VRKLLVTGALVLFGIATPAGSTLAASSAPALYHVPIIGLQRSNATDVKSTNWAGYVDTSDTYQTVSSSWTQPTVTCPTGLFHPASYSAFWVGLDGYTSGSVEQTGTDSDCKGNGTPSYYAWYEFYPAGSVTLPTSTNPVRPGDTLTGSVTSNSAGTSFTLSLSDPAENWSFSLNMSGSGLARSSAEWVAEAPSSCFITCHVLPLADFGTMGFTNASATDTASKTGSISAFSDVDIQMASGNTVKATPSSTLGSNGASFTVSWSHS